MHGSVVSIPLLLAAALCGCTGSVSSHSRLPSADDDPGNAGGAGATGGANQDLDAANVGPAGLRRLTRRELDNTLSDLLGDRSHVALTFFADPSNVSNGYETFLPLGGAELQQYRDAAERLAASAVSNLSNIAPCAAGAMEAVCAKSMIEKMGKRAFRRPLDDGETAALLDVYSKVRAQIKGSYADAIRVVLTAMLQDPRFLYQRQLGKAKRGPDGLAPLDGFDMASRLSYALWRTMPDAKLFEAADADRLSSDADIATQVTRMLADPRAHEFTAGWVSSLLALDKLSTLSRPADKYPQWSSTLADAMRADTEDFVAEIVFGGDAKIGSLFSSTAAFVTPALANVYGSTGEGRVDLDPKQRGGLLTKAAFLTVSQSSVLRGKFVREQLFCQHMPPPPPNAQGQGKVAPPNASERERANLHSQDPSCASCHKLMDPIGFALLAYDAIGRFQTADGGAPVDARGNLASTDVDGDIAGAGELSKRLSQSDDVKQCLSARWFRALLAREESDADAGTLAAATRALNTGAHPLADMLASLASSTAFRFRTPLPGEPTQ